MSAISSEKMRAESWKMKLSLVKEVPSALEKEIPSGKMKGCSRKKESSSKKDVPYGKIESSSEKHFPSGKIKVSSRNMEVSDGKTEVIDQEQECKFEIVKLNIDSLILVG